MNADSEFELIEESLNFGLESIYPKPKSYRFQSKELSNTPNRDKNLSQNEIKVQQNEGTETNDRGK